MSRVKLTSATVIMLVLTSPARAQHTTSPALLLEQGLAAYEAAVAASHNDPRAADRQYRTAIDAFEQLIDLGYDNAALHYNLGNAYFRINDRGRSIAAYRRAAALAPRDTRIAANLEYVRARVEPTITPAGSEALLTRLLFWTRLTTAQFRLGLGMVAAAVGWVAVVLWVWRRWRPLLALGIPVIILATANIASVAWEYRQRSAQPPAIIVDEPHVLRQGRGDAYEPVIAEQLGPGVELTILQSRADWAEVALRDGTTGWLPEAALIRIWPR